MKRTSSRTLYICQGAIIAALYVALTYLANALGLASGAIQVRFSEMLCILPVFTTAAIPGVTVGCLLANIFTGCCGLDIIFGTVATLIGAFGTFWLRRNKWLAPVPPILANALIIPFVLMYGYGAEDAYWYLLLTVAAGEIISVYVLGGLLMRLMEKRFPVYEETRK